MYDGALEPRISLITIGVDDLAVQRAFYRKLGWEESSAGNDSVAFFKLQGTVLGLWSRESLAKEAGVADDSGTFRGVTLAQNVESKAAVEAVLAEAVRAGATVTKPAGDVFWGGYNGYFADPEGNLWEIAWNPGFPFNDDGSIRLP